MASKLLLLALLASFFICDAGWTDPVSLMNLKYGILTDACLDSNNHTLLLLQKGSSGSKDLIALTYVSDESYIDNIRQVMRNEGVDGGYPRNRLVCRRNANNEVMVFSVTARTGGAGVLTESSQDGDFIEKYKKENIAAGSLLFTNSTGRTTLFLANKTSIWFVTRPAGSEIFSNEQIIYTKNSFYISDLASAASKRRNEFLWHVAARVGKEVYYFLGSGNGVKWDTPYPLENVAVRDSANYQISFVANYDISSAVFFIYFATTSELCLTWTSNNADTWSRPANSHLGNSFFSTYGFLYTIDNNPALFLSDSAGNYVISKSWTEKQIEFVAGKAPVRFPMYTPQVSPSSLLQGFGINERGWVASTNQTDGSSEDDR